MVGWYRVYGLPNRVIDSRSGKYHVNDCSFEDANAETYTELLLAITGSHGYRDCHHEYASHTCGVHTRDMAVFKFHLPAARKSDLGLFHRLAAYLGDDCRESLCEDRMSTRPLPEDIQQEECFHIHRNILDCNNVGNVCCICFWLNSVLLSPRKGYLLGEGEPQKRTGVILYYNVFP